MKIPIENVALKQNQDQWEIYLIEKEGYFNFETIQEGIDAPLLAKDTPLNCLLFFDAIRDEFDDKTIEWINSISILETIELWLMELSFYDKQFNEVPFLLDPQVIHGIVERLTFIQSELQKNPNIPVLNLLSNLDPPLSDFIQNKFSGFDLVTERYNSSLQTLSPSSLDDDRLSRNSSNSSSHLTSKSLLERVHEFKQKVKFPFLFFFLLSFSFLFLLLLFNQIFFEIDFRYI